MLETTALFRTMKLSNIGSGQDSSEMGDHLETPGARSIGLDINAAWRFVDRVEFATTPGG